MNVSSLVAEILAVLAKELRSELRSRVAMNAVVLFGLTTLVAVAYQVGPFGISEADRPVLLSALLWVILFFAATSGLSRVFVKEEDAHTAKTLRLAAAPMAVFGGKLLFNLVLLLALETFLTPLYCVLMGFSVASVTGLALVLLAGGISLSASTTLVAAIIARASRSSALFAILAIPIALPLLIVLIHGTKAAAGSQDAAAVFPALRAVLSLGGATVVASALLFPAVWRD
jgi:heme exporter protein B